jgi:hypothetical protein
VLEERIPKEGHRRGIVVLLVVVHSKVQKIRSRRNLFVSSRRHCYNLLKRMSQWLLEEGVIDPITLNYIMLFDGTSQWLLEEGVTDSVRHAVLMRASLLHWARTLQGISTE